MTDRWRYWLPRILGILLAVFLSLFAFDVFTEGYGFWEVLVALFMHLVPTFLLVVALVVAWRWERLGGLLFIGLGVLFWLLLARADLIALLLIGLPAIVIGALFLWDGVLRGGRRASQRN